MCQMMKVNLNRHLESLSVMVEALSLNQIANLQMMKMMDRFC